MLGFGSLGQFSLGENGGLISVNLLGAAAIAQAGILRGQVSGFTFSGAAGVGTAGTITPNPQAIPTGAVGNGVAGLLNSFNVTVAFAGAAGIGVARAITPQVSAAQSGATGTGVAGSLNTSAESITLAPAVGVGVANTMRDQVSVVVPRVTGTGTAGTIGRFDIALTIPSATGIGTTGAINIASVSIGLLGVAGIGTTNYVARPFQPYTFVELVHFDAYPVIYRPDVVAVSVVLASAVGGGVAGQIRPVISGGGGSSAADGDRRKKRKTGFEPIKKLPPSEPIAASPRAPLPPFQDSPALVPDESSPLDLVDRDLIPENLLGLRDQIRAAQESYADQQDAEDIADILAILDHEDGI